MDLVFLRLFIVFTILAILVICAEYNFINQYRKKRIEHMDPEYNTLIFLLMHPDYNFKTLFIALKRDSDKELEKARITYLLVVIVTVLYMFGIGVYITNY